MASCEDSGSATEDGEITNVSLRRTAGLGMVKYITPQKGSKPSV